MRFRQPYRRSFLRYKNAVFVALASILGGLLFIMVIYYIAPPPTPQIEYASPHEETPRPSGWTANEVVEHFTKHVIDSLSFRQGYWIAKHDGLVVFKLVGVRNGVLRDSKKLEYLQFMCACAGDDIHLVVWGGYASSGSASPNLSAFTSFDIHYRPELDRFSKSILRSAFVSTTKPHRVLYWPKVFPFSFVRAETEPFYWWIFEGGVDRDSLLELVAKLVHEDAERSVEFRMASGKKFSATEIVARGWLGKGWRRLWLFTLTLDSGQSLLVAEGGISADGKVIPDMEGFYPSWHSATHDAELWTYLNKILLRMGATSYQKTTAGGQQ